MQKLLNFAIVWVCGGMGEKTPPTRPYPYTAWKPKGNAELYGLMHGSVSAGVFAILRNVPNTPPASSPLGSAGVAFEGVVPVRVAAA